MRSQTYTAQCVCVCVCIWVCALVRERERGTYSTAKKKLCTHKHRAHSKVYALQSDLRDPQCSACMLTKHSRVKWSGRVELYTNHPQPPPPPNLPPILRVRVRSVEAPDGALLDCKFRCNLNDTNGRGGGGTCWASIKKVYFSIINIYLSGSWGAYNFAAQQKGLSYLSVRCRRCRCRLVVVFFFCSCCASIFVQCWCNVQSESESRCSPHWTDAMYQTKIV